MSTKKYISALAASFVFISAGLVGCGSEYDGGDGELAVEAVGDGIKGEAIGEAEQALTTCTEDGSGGGTWGSVILLCATSDNKIFVKKQDGGQFTSSGKMNLEALNAGMVWVKYPSAGVWTVSFGQKPSDCYQATFYSNAPGIAYTDVLCI
jgi:hypothetical protein